MAGAKERRARHAKTIARANRRRRVKFEVIHRAIHRLRCDDTWVTHFKSNISANARLTGNMFIVASMQQPIQPQQHEHFLRLYAENEVALHTFVRTLVPTRQEASDVMQDVIVALWQGYITAVEFRPWAFGVARNVVRMHLRRRMRDRHVFDDELVNRLADKALQQEQQHADEREALEHCLKKLPRSQKELVLHAYTKGTRMDDLANRRGQTPMSLYKQLHRIRQALQQCVTLNLAKEEPT